MLTVCEEIVDGEQCGLSFEEGADIRLTFAGHVHLDTMETEEVAKEWSLLAGQGVQYNRLDAFFRAFVAREEYDEALENFGYDPEEEEEEVGGFTVTLTVDFSDADIETPERAAELAAEFADGWTYTVRDNWTGKTITVDLEHGEAR